MKKLLLTSSCLALGLAAGPVQAAVSYWEPAGSQAANYTGSMSGTWESALWSSATSVIQTSAFVENNAAGLSYRAGGGTPAFTVTMNSTHTVAGFFVTLGGSATNCTVAGPGTTVLYNANLNGISLNSTNNFTLAVRTTGSSTAGLCPEGSGQLYLNGTNAYTGCTYLGYSGASFNGIVNFNNSASFGNSNIVFLNCTGGAFVAEGSSPITITNGFVDYYVNTYNVTNGVPTDSENLNIVGNPAGVTFSGAMVLSGGQPGAGAGTYATNNRILPSYAQVSIGSGGATNNLVILSGTISGTNFFNKYGVGILSLAGTNTLSGGLNVSNGTLQIAATGSISNLTKLSLGTNTFFDVTAFPTFTMSPTTRLQAANSTEVIAGETSPSLLPSPTGTFNLGTSPIDLNYTTTDPAEPPLLVPQGALAFNTNTITISNSSGTPFSAGEYVELIVIGDGNTGTYTGTSASTIQVLPGGMTAGCVALPYWSGSTLYAAITATSTGTTTAITNSPSITYGASPSITAAVTPDPSASGGSVQFYLNGAAIGSAVPVLTGGVAVFTNASSLLMVGGTNSITAEYSGSPDAAYGSSVATAVLQAVTPAPLTVTANTQTTAYGTVPAATLADYTITGLVFSDTVASLSDTLTGVEATNTPVGTYANAIVPSALAGAGTSTFTAGNYAITYVPGTWVVTQKSLTITPKATVKVYGSVLSLTGFTNNTLTTIANGQTSAVQVNLTTAGAAANSPVGAYALTASAASEIAGKTNFDPNNYAITYGSGTLTVTNLPVILSGTRAFDGTANANASILTVSNAVAGDDVSVASGAATLSGSAVGTNAITSVGTLVLGGVTASNYTLVGATGSVIITSGSFSITSAALDSTKTNLIVCFQSTSGQSYNVLTNTQLNSQGSWVDIGAPISPVVATGTNTCVTIPGVIPSNPATFILIKQ